MYAHLLADQTKTLSRMQCSLWPANT